MKAKFTGHDTFPLRYGWLYKAVNHLNNNGKLQTSNEKKTQEAIVKLGVGKNMVNAIRYWAESAAVIKTDKDDGNVHHDLSKSGKYLFGDNGKDPYLEKLGSIWLVHFWLNFNEEHLTSYRYFFNFSNVQHFEKSQFISDCIHEAKSIVTNDIGLENTIKKDIDCFLNTYSKKFRPPSSKKSESINEDHFTSPLSELNLIQDNGGGFYVSNLSERKELPIEIFIYSLLEYFAVETNESDTSNIDFDSLLIKPCSPGRIFRLSEAGLGQKLDEAQRYTEGAISWVDSLGLRQVNVNRDFLSKSYDFLDNFYSESKH